MVIAQILFVPVSRLQFFRRLRQRRWPRRVRIVSVEAVAEKWLVPRLVTFKAAHPGVAIELETNHRGVDPARRGSCAWCATSCACR